MAAMYGVLKSVTATLPPARSMPRRIQFAFDRAHDGGRARAAVVGLELHPIPVARIVAGGDHHAAGRAQVLHCIRQSRRRREVVGETHVNARAREHLGDDLRRSLRSEARIVAYDQAFAGVFVLVDVDRHGVAYAPHVVEGEIVGDDAAPTVGPKLDLCAHVDSLASTVLTKIAQMASANRELPAASHTSRFIFFSSRYFTTLPTSCECSRVVISSASSVSTTTRLSTPTAATNLFPASMKLPVAFSVKL